MRHIFWILIASLIAVPISAEETPRTNIVWREPPKTDIRFESGPVQYVEQLVNGHWMGRYWNSSGRINWPFEMWKNDAFQIEINGESVAGDWQWVSAAELPRTDRGQRHFVVELAQPQRELTVKIHTLLDGTPVLVRWLEITNRGQKSVALTRISPWSTQLWSNPGVKDPVDKMPEVFRVGYFTRDDWASEGWFKWKGLKANDRLEVTSRKGYGYDEPFFIVQNSMTGEHVIGHLAWYSNSYMDFACGEAPPDIHPWGDKLAPSSWLSISLGPLAQDALRVIAAGETVRSPAVHLGTVTGTFDAAVDAMHDHIRRFVLPTRKKERANLIEYLGSGDQGYLDEHGRIGKRGVFSNIDLAAAIGCELFILDANWYEKRGDWVPNKKIFPQGLDPVIKYCREKGMLFGLWIEPERAAPGSYLTVEQPKWVLEHGNIDMTQPDAAAYVEAELRREVRDYDLDLIRVAYDTYFPNEGGVTERDGFRENNYWRQFEVVDAMYERLRAQHPDLIMQNCSFGIGRGGLGMVGRFHEGYLTDGLWMPQVMQVYSGCSAAFPPEMFAMAVGAVLEQAEGRPSDFDTYLRCQFTLSSPQLISGMVGPSLDQISPARLQKIQRYAKLYKEFIRPLLPTCRVYHHEPINGRGGVDSSPWFAMEFVAPDKTQGWALIARMENSDEPSYLFKPKGLDVAKTYRVTFDSSGSMIEIKGWELVRDGLAIPLETRTASELLLFEAR